MTSRVVALLLPVVATIALFSCGPEAGHPGGAAPPPGVGYGSASATSEDVRVLSKDDCVTLRDHQIEIAVGAALGDAGLDQGARLQLEAKLRAEEKTKTDEWVKRCSGRVVSAVTFRCWKEATTPQTLVACEALPPDASPETSD